MLKDRWTILFRAQNAETKKWIFGYPLSINRKIIDAMQNIHNYRFEYIYSSTLSQFTNMYDVDNNRLFIGDILSDGKHNYLIEYIDSAFVISYYEYGLRSKASYSSNKLKLIGNKWDNPNLIEGIK